MKDRLISLPASIRNRLPSQAREIYQAVFTSLLSDPSFADSMADPALRIEKAHQVAVQIVRGEYSPEETPSASEDT
ncbi:MAG: ChaB family protein [Armatimonadetes bacterium]|nr:ChaB family protein [Armatimonadota bacterium]